MDPGKSSPALEWGGKSAPPRRPRPLRWALPRTNLRPCATEAVGGRGGLPWEAEEPSSPLPGARAAASLRELPRAGWLLWCGCVRVPHAAPVTEPEGFAVECRWPQDTLPRRGR